MSEALLRKLILTLCNLKIDRNQQTISRLLARVHWYRYWQFPWSFCTHRYTHCVYTPISHRLSVPSAHTQSSRWLSELLQRLIPSVIWTYYYHYQYFISTVMPVHIFLGIGNEVLAVLSSFGILHKHFRSPFIKEADKAHHWGIREI